MPRLPHHHSLLGVVWEFCYKQSCILPRRFAAELGGTYRNCSMAVTQSMECSVCLFYLGTSLSSRYFMKYRLLHLVQAGVEQTLASQLLIQLLLLAQLGHCYVHPCWRCLTKLGLTAGLHIISLMEFALTMYESHPINKFMLLKFNGATTEFQTVYTVTQIRKTAWLNRFLIISFRSAPQHTHSASLGIRRQRVPCWQSVCVCSSGKP